MGPDGGAKGAIRESLIWVSRGKQWSNKGNKMIVLLCGRVSLCAEYIVHMVLMQPRNQLGPSLFSYWSLSHVHPDPSVILLTPITYVVHITR